MRRTYVARSRRRCVGRLDVVEERRAAYVTSLFVASAWRRQGIGTALMHALARDLRGRRVFRVDLDDMTAPGNPFYARLGFRRMGDGPESRARVRDVLRLADGRGHVVEKINKR